MKKFIGVFALVSLLASTAQASTIFSYSFTGNNGGVVNGTFTGTASGNFITGLSDITANLNGNAFHGSGNLFGSSYNSWSGWVSGGAVASFDGSQNNFLFIDSDYPNYSNYSNYFYSVAAFNQSYAYMSSPWGYTYDNATTANWHVTSANVPEPSSVILFGLGLIALARFRRKHA